MAGGHEINDGSAKIDGVLEHHYTDPRKLPTRHVRSLIFQFTVIGAVTKQGQRRGEGKQGNQIQKRREKKDEFVARTISGC